MSDTKNTILLRFLKMYFIGSAGIGKSTTRNRLIGWITNLSSLPVEERKRWSTYLAECNQVLAIMDENKAKLTLKASNFGDFDDETRMLFAYVHNHILTDSLASPVNEHPSQDPNASPAYTVKATLTESIRETGLHCKKWGVTVTPKWGVNELCPPDTLQ